MDRYMIKTNVNDISLKGNKFDIQDLSLYYGDFEALKKMSFFIPSNAVTALIGPSGAARVASCAV
jgi:phosphate transport system ATP-binding protein